MAEKKFLVDLNLNKNELKQAVVENQGLAPTSPKDGQIYYNTSSGTKGVNVYKTNAWKKLADEDDLATKVPTSRTVNGKALSSDITLYGTDIPIDNTTGADNVKEYIDNLDITISGAASTIKDDDLTQNRAVISNADGKIAVSEVTSTELGYLDGVTSAIQTQIDNKVTKNNNITAATKCKITYDAKGLVTAGADLAASDIPDLSATYIATTQKGVANGVATLDANTLVPAAQLPAATTTTKGAVIVDSSISSSSTNPVQNSAISTALNGKQATITGAATTIASSNLTASRALISNASGKVAVSSVTSTELGYLSGVTANIQNQIDNLEARGRFLSLWNGATGKPETNPGELPFTYKTGDYYIIDNTSSTTNYRPNGSSYTGSASTTVETESVAANDVYYYDGTNWLLQVNTQREVTFSSITGQPTDNTNLANALNLKADLASPTFTGTPTAPTATTGTNTTQVATTAFVQDAIATASLTLAANNTALTQSGGVCTWTITNTLNNADVICSVREVSSGEEVYCNITYTAASIVIKINSSTNIAAGTYRAVVIGQKINS